MQAWDNLFNYQQSLYAHQFPKSSDGSVCQDVTYFGQRGCQIMSKSDIRLVDPLDIYLSCLVQRCYNYYELHKKLIPNICSDDKLSTYNCAAALGSWLSKSVEFYMFFFLVFLAKFSHSHVSFIRSFILIRGGEKWGNSSHIRMHFLWDNIYAMSLQWRYIEMSLEMRYFVSNSKAEPCPFKAKFSSLEKSSV